MAIQVNEKPGVEPGKAGADAGHETVFVDQFTDGILDPAKPMLGPVRDGGHIVANTAPGCWGPMITPEPVVEDLPFTAQPLSEDERARARAIAESWGTQLEESAPISVVGTGPDLNSATDNGLERAAKLLEMSVPEVKNRATITGGIEIGRHPGVVQVTFRAPLERLEARGLLPFVNDQYGIQ